MFGLGVQELLLILVMVLIFFGAEKIPQLARSLGKGMSEFRKAQQDVKDELFKETAPTQTINEPEEDGKKGEEPQTYSICPSCGAQTSVGSKFCSNCGKEMSLPVVCGVCQRPLAEDDKFCPNCGEARPVT